MDASDCAACPDTSAASVLPFVKDVVKPGSIVRTDGSWAYQKLEKLGYRRERTVIKGAVNPKLLDYYLDEFTFRFNRRTSRSRGLLFYRLLQQAVLTEPVTYAQISGKAKHNISGGGGAKWIPLE